MADQEILEDEMKIKKDNMRTMEIAIDAQREKARLKEILADLYESCTCKITAEVCCSCCIHL